MPEKVRIEELNTWIPLASFESLPAEEQKMRLQYWKEHFTNKEITAGLGTYNSKLYDLYKKHKIPTQGTAHPKRKGKKKHQLIQNFLLSPNLSKRNQLHPLSQCKMHP
ncbi:MULTISPECIES: hypothetical protein [Bacillus]|uniref:hypothetical protein n=1 Tax=Bacillus TaxID=1386 RepID=UPI0020C9F526|nr:hypothetical protein [Bacillus cereus]